MVNLIPKIIENPFNYTGSKHRILPLILNNIPNVTKVVDVFGGSGEVGLSIGIPCLYNDLNKPLTCIIRTIQELSLGYMFDVINEYIAEFKLSKDNKSGFLNFRKQFNECRWFEYLDYSRNDILRWQSCLALYTLMCYAFNYQLTFNKSGEYCVPSGYKRSSFNNNLRKKLTEYKYRLDEFGDNFQVTCKDFNLILDEYISSNNDLSDVLFFVDPPYLISDDIYSRTNNLKWNEKKEKELYLKLLTIHKMDGKIMITNQLSKGDKENKLLKDFIIESGFDYLNTNVDFYNCSYQRKNKGNDKEVIIKNY